MSFHTHSLMLLCLLVASMTGCISAVRMDGDRYYPRNPKFTIKPQNYTEQDLARYGLRTDGVYVDIGFRPPSENVHVPGFPMVVRGTSYLRFWPNGRVLSRTSEKGVVALGDVTIADSFTRAMIGYYELTEDGRFRAEWYFRYGGKWRYRTVIYTIEGNELWDCVPPSRERHNPIGDVSVQAGRRFIKIEGMIAEPDW